MLFDLTFMHFQEARSKLDSCLDSMRAIIQKHKQGLLQNSNNSVNLDFIDHYINKVAAGKDPTWSGEQGMMRIMGALDTIPLGGDGLIMAFNTIFFCLAKCVSIFVQKTFDKSFLVWPIIASRRSKKSFER